MMKKFILVLSFIVISCWAQAEDEAFSLDILYNYAGKRLVISMERLSRDETQHFMYRLEILKNGVLNMEESLINQNHLNKIEKWVPFHAKVGDKITVQIIYGTEQAFVRSIIVEDQENKRIVETNSILIGEDKVKDDLKIKPFSKKKKEEPSAREFGYSVEKEEEYGYEDFGEKIESEPYGYPLEDSEIYSKKTIGLDEENLEDYGYEDEGILNVGQSGFGYSDFGYEGDPELFGREDYEINKE